MKLLTFAVAVLPASAFAASFVAVSCSPALHDPVTIVNTADSTSCSGGSDGSSGRGFAIARGQVDLQLSADPAAFSSFYTLESSFVQQARPQNDESSFGPGSSATVGIQYQAFLQTGGPVRQGFLQLRYDYYSAPFYDGMATIASGFLSSNSTVACSSTAVITNSCNPGLTHFQNSPYVAVTLGVPLTLQSMGTLSNQAGGFDGASGGSLSITYQFKFLESDLTTPVAILQAAPEPATLLPMLAALLLLVLIAIRRQRQSAQCIVTQPTAPAVLI